MKLNEKRIVDYLESKNRHCIVWNESANGINLDKRAVVQYWKEAPKPTAKFLNGGGKAILSPFSYCYFETQNKKAQPQLCLLFFIIFICFARIVYAVSCVVSFVIARWQVFVLHFRCRVPQPFDTNATPFDNSAVQPVCRQK